MLSSDAREGSNWDYWSQSLCMFANANRDTKKQKALFSYEEFHPFKETKKKKEKQVPIKISMKQAAKLMFGDKIKVKEQ